MRKAVEVDPENVDAVTWLGKPLRGLGRWDECRAMYRRALEIDPGEQRRHAAAGRNVVARSCRAEALGSLMEASRLQPNPRRT